jgi:hypothetical protein
MATARARAIQLWAHVQELRDAAEFAKVRGFSFAYQQLLDVAEVEFNLAVKATAEAERETCEDIKKGLM